MLSRNQKPWRSKREAWNHSVWLRSNVC